ncbi:steroid C26-monooxygenase Cyp142 [Nonomuraea roseoviolacea subsp. roseoviolacea]|uniref:cytochrome P450 n=1 Tax=Nonomuraea roseoviolacea TaxID=103837 RepID=UPI0031D8B6BB
MTDHPVRHAVDHPVNDAIDLTSGAFWGRDPHEELRWMRENAPVYWDGKVWGVASYRDVRRVSLNPRAYSNAQGIRPDSGPLPMMIDMDDPAHLLRRRLVSRGFTPRRVAAQAERIERLCDQILDRVCERGECDFVWDIAAPLPLIVIGDALGVAPEDRDALMRWSDDMLRGLVGQADSELLVRAGEAFEQYEAYANRIIDDRRACPRDDLISTLVHAEVDGDRLAHDSLLYECLLILIGGDETTRHVLSGGVYQLLVHPDQRRALAEDPARIPAAVEEMLRWVSPIKNMNRTVVADTELGGQRLRAGDQVLLLYPSANRDETVFADPYRFDVARTPNDHIAFGFGSHFCLGNSLARLEVRTMVERLLRRMPDMEPVGAAEPASRPANFISGYESMPVRFTPSAPVGA